MKLLKLLKLVVVSAFLGQFTVVQAATQQVSGGILTGATGVLVGTTLYDVSFVDGRCSVLFSPCTTSADFTFQTQADAELASQALLDQVFLDTSLGAFDTQPELTRGIQDVTTGIILTPFDFFVVFPTVYVNSVFAQNSIPPRPGEDHDGIGCCIGLGNDTFDTTYAPRYTFAVWSLSPIAPIPEPETYAMLLAGLGLLGFAARRRKQQLAT